MSKPWACSSPPGREGEGALELQESVRESFGGEEERPKKTSHPSVSSLTAVLTVHLLAAGKACVLRALHMAPKQPLSMACCRISSFQPKTYLVSVLAVAGS